MAAVTGTRNKMISNNIPEIISPDGHEKNDLFTTSEAGVLPSPL